MWPVRGAGRVAALPHGRQRGTVDAAVAAATDILCAGLEVGVSPGGGSDGVLGERGHFSAIMAITGFSCAICSAARCRVDMVL